MANHLASLQIDLSDPDFHRLLLEDTRRQLTGYRALLDEAVDAGEIVPCDTARLARTMAALAGGSLLTWATLREGRAKRWVRDDLTTLLEPYRRHWQRPPRRPPRSPGAEHEGARGTAPAPAKRRRSSRGN
jgi:hypothetical protein